jgi:hypothetical protein
VVSILIVDLKACNFSFYVASYVNIQKESF